MFYSKKELLGYPGVAISRKKAKNRKHSGNALMRSAIFKDLKVLQIIVLILSRNGEKSDGDNENVKNCKSKAMN